MYEDKESSKKQKKAKRENRFFVHKPKKEKEVKEVNKEVIITDKNVNSKKEETKKFMSLKADWVSILVKFGIFLLVAFFIIFVVTKIKQLTDKNTFSSNMEKMKEVGYVYYKVEKNRPSGLNEETQMTLEDMIDASLIKELKEGKTVCSKDFSYVSLTKREKNYDLTVYLSCGGEAKNAVYPVDYSTLNDGVTNTETVTLYEQTRITETNSNYTCPSGYLLAGDNCVLPASTKIIDASIKYRTTPETNTAAKYKSSGYSYEYVNPLVNVSAESFKCPSGYELSNSDHSKCYKYIDAYYKKETTYTCDSGTPTGTHCLTTLDANYSKEQAYCTRGTLVNNNSCYIHKSYAVKCVTGKKDSITNSCYTTYTPRKELTDWLFYGKVTYSGTYDPKDTNTVRYEEDYTKENGYIVYRKYIRKYESICDGSDELKSGVCRHYDDSYSEKYCSGSSWHLSNDGSECYTYIDAKYKNTSGSYTCPSGYSKKGYGSNTTCVKYENATKTTQEIARCVSGYDLTSDNRCVKEISSTKEENKTNYTCPTGYDPRGSGANTICYKKVSTDAYYYCSNTSATLSGDRCIVPAKSTVIGYTCPSDYDNYGSKCYQFIYSTSIKATKNNGNSSSTETIWSKEKNLNGWTFTVNTKESQE